MPLLRSNVLRLVRNYSKIGEKPVEVTIPIPWGHISGKWWGSQSKRPILVLHGYQDNCGSFDRLLPALSEHHSFLAIDLPGHGLSSWFPKGMFYNFFNGAITIRQIMEYFNWPKISLMGHSMGGMLCYSYTTYLPHYVDMLICIDGVLPIVFPDYTERNGRLIEKLMKYSKLNDSPNEPPAYTMEEIEKKLHDGTNKSIDTDKCKYILERCTAPSKVHPGKYYFSMDQRLKAGPHFVGVPELYPADIDRIKCPIFLTIPKGSPFYNEKYRKYSQKYIDQFQAKENCEVHFIDGTHHVHLNNPENVQNLINTFILKYDKEDRTIGGIREEIKECGRL